MNAFEFGLYSISQWKKEILFRECGLRAVILRPHMMIT